MSDAPEKENAAGSDNANAEETEPTSPADEAPSPKEKETEGETPEEGGEPGQDETVEGGEEGVVELPLIENRLQHTWVLWYDSRKLQAQGGVWFDNLQQVSTMGTVEAFWSTYNHVKRPAELDHGANYHLFKQGIKPMWEDEMNEKGGKWTIALSSREEMNRIDELWELLVLSMIGEYLEEEGEDGVPVDSLICGAVMSKRKSGNKIAVWIKESANMELVYSVRDRLISALKMEGGNDAFSFQSHAPNTPTAPASGMR